MREQYRRNHDAERGLELPDRDLSLRRQQSHPAPAGLPYGEPVGIVPHRRPRGPRDRRGHQSHQQSEPDVGLRRSEEQTSELQSLKRNSYAVYSLNKKKTYKYNN